jgi:hypothetical protein
VLDLSAHAERVRERRADGNADSGFSDVIVDRSAYGFRFYARKPD